MFFVTSLACVAITATAEDRWYQLGVSLCQGGCVQTFTGTLPFGTSEIQTKSSESGFVKISNLVYFDNQQKAKPLTEWNEKLKPEIYIKANSIVSIQELNGNPLAK